jgi:ASTRA-associated protein 1
MDVNALNYCRFSLMPIESEAIGSDELLIALPNLVDSAVVHDQFSQTHPSAGILI